MSKSAGQILQRSFLAGEQINIHDYAHRTRINSETIRHAIRAFHKIGAIEAKTVRKNGQVAKIWAVADEEILSAWQAGKPPTQNIVAPDFSGLLDAFGIRVTNIDLPSFVHRMKTAADDREE